MNNNSHGGPRKGAGRKPISTGGIRKQVTLDRYTIDALTVLGAGNLSEGIRRAAELVLTVNSLNAGLD